MKGLQYLYIFSCLVSFAIYGQYENNTTYGIKLGVLNSRISNLPEMIIGQDNSFQNYSLESEGSYGYEGGFFLNYKLPDTRVALQPELLYRKSGETVSYSDNVGKEYKLELNYTYLEIGALYKIYPYEGLNIGIGAFYGINLTPNNVSYTSNEADGSYDVATSQFYKDGLSGRDDFSLCFSLGYELTKGLNFDLRYYYGVSDVIESSEASFQFIENKNKSSVLCFSVGYSFDEW